MALFKEMCHREWVSRVQSSTFAHLALSVHGCLSVLCYLPAKLSATVPAPAPHFLACCHTPHHSGDGLTLRNYKLQVNSSFYKCPQSWFLSTATEQ